MASRIEQAIQHGLIQARLFEGYFANGPLRDPAGPQTSFASEQLIDELAYAANIDPLAFRRLNVSDDRWIGVLNAAAQAARWKPRVANAATSWIF